MANLCSKNSVDLYWLSVWILTDWLLIDFRNVVLNFYVGSDRNLSSSILEHRAELLSSMVRFFHCDIQTMSDQFANTDDHYKNLSDKLYHTFETILPILQYNGNVFQNMPISRLPKVEINFHFGTCC